MPLHGNSTKGNGKNEMRYRSFKNGNGKMENLLRNEPDVSSTTVSKYNRITWFDIVRSRITNDSLKKKSKFND